MKTSSSKAAISMIMEKPENEILLLQDILPIRFNRFMTNASMEMEAFEKTATGDGGF